MVLVDLFGDQVPSPEGQDGTREEGSSAASFLSFFLSSAGQSPFCMLLSAWLLAHSSAEASPEGSQDAGLLRGACGVPGPEERRAEWLTTVNFCFSVGLGWGIFFFFLHVSKFLLPLFEEPLLFILSSLLSILSEEPGLRLLWDVQKVAVPGSDADKPVGRGGACRCECCPVAWPEPSEHTNCTNSFSESCPWWWW